MFRLPVSIAITVGAAVLVVIAPCRAGGSPLQSNFELVQQLKQIQQQLMGEALERRGPSLWWQELGVSDRAGPASDARIAKRPRPGPRHRT